MIFDWVDRRLACMGYGVLTHTHLSHHTHKNNLTKQAHHGHGHGHSPATSAASGAATTAASLAQGLAGVNLTSLNAATAVAGKGMKSVADELVRKAWQR